MQSLVKTKHGYYKIRIRVYDKLVPYFNRKEINKSLKTKNLNEARVKATELINEYLTIKTYADLSYTTDEILTTLTNNFMEGTCKKPTLTTTPRTPKLTYRKAIDDFCLYYNSKEIRKQTKIAVSNFLQDVFITLIGANTYLKDTTLNDLIKIKNILLNLPARNNNKYRDKSISELVKKEIPSEDKLSISKVQSNLSYIKRFYKYCEAHQLIKYNPAEYITIRTSVSSLDERESYTKDEIRKLLSLVDKVENINTRVIYYTLAYTGMRLSELWKCSVKQKEGIYYFDLTDRKLQLKTRSSYRLIPLHKELIKRDIHHKLEEAVSTYESHSLSTHFRRNIKDKISDNPRKVLYSLRHTFATQLKHTSVDPLVISELMGHAHGGMTMGRYADRFPVEVLKEAIDKLEF